MYDSAPAADPTSGDSQRTAFRRAEKQYKLYQSDAPTSRKSKKPLLNRCDLSDVVDFRSISEEFERSGKMPRGIFKFDCSGFEKSVFCFEDRPGFYFIPSALTIEEQCYWIRESLMNFPQPPNRTNLTAIYGPIADLLDAVRGEKILVEVESLADVLYNGLNIGKDCVIQPNYVFSEGNCDAQIEGKTKTIAASVLLRKMRWSTLGLQFDWSKRNYDVCLPHNKIPESLSRLAKKMAIPAMPPGEEFQPEAAIVNYFGPSDMLGGHLDDMEVDWSKPIVSISLGCKAIFLLGGKTREDAPKSMFLRSGDIVLMAGQARECFHGVPRIFTDNEHSEISTIMSRLPSEEDRCFADYLKNSRININIRQVN